jgi:hypothetical protein
MRRNCNRAGRYSNFCFVDSALDDRPVGRCCGRRFERGDPPLVGGGSPRCVGGVLPLSGSGVRSHVGPGWGLLGVFTMFDLQRYWCAILGLNQLASESAWVPVCWWYSLAMSVSHIVTLLHEMRYQAPAQRTPTPWLMGGPGDEAASTNR